MTIDPDHLRAILAPIARFVDDHTANASPDDEVIMAPLPVGLLRPLRDLHDKLDAS